MRFLIALFRPDRRRVIVALVLCAVIYLGALASHGFGDHSDEPLLYRWLSPLMAPAWLAWIFLFMPLAWLSKTLIGTDDWVWAMGFNPSGVVFSYFVVSLVVATWDGIRWGWRRATRAGS